MARVENQRGKKRRAVAIGNFDGFHIGHARILEKLRQAAWEKGLDAVILTFTPHPKVFFGKELHLINNDEQRRELLKSAGVGDVVFVNFEDIADLAPGDFVRDFLVREFNIQYIVVGENFRFGRNREGHIESLKDFSVELGFHIETVKPVTLAGNKVSSSFIRTRLREGEIGMANRMLGRPYFIDGTVVEGEKMGRELGFPTINVAPDNTLLPEGVFKTEVRIGRGKRCYESITNIGSRPTFLGNERRVESHILGFDRTIYGKSVRIYFKEKIRNEMKFDSEFGLVKQIRQDIEKVKVDKEKLF